MCTKEQTDQAKRYLYDEGYGAGSNFTVNAVANLMAEWADKNKDVPVCDCTHTQACEKCAESKGIDWDEEWFEELTIKEDTK